MPARRTLAVVVSWLLVLWFVAPPPAPAAWSHLPSANQAVFNWTGSQATPVVVPDGSGGTIVFWQDGRNGNNDYYARHLAADGAVGWGASGVAVCTAAGSQSLLAACSDGAGGAIAVWRDYRSGTNFDIYAQRVTSAGTAAWTTNGVAIRTLTSAQDVPLPVPDGSGGAYLFWQDSRNGSDTDLYVQRISSLGVPQWSTNGVSICAATGTQTLGMAIPDGSGGAIVVWVDSRTSIYTDIYAQRITASATIAWPADGLVICNAAYFQTEPAVALDEAGGAVFVWRDFHTMVRPEIYAQRVTLGGTIDWAEDGRPVCSADNDRGTPVIAPDGAGGTIVAWKDYRSGDQWDVYAQRLTAEGPGAWAYAGVAVCTATNDQSGVRMVGDGQGGAVISWQDERGGQGVDLYAQRLDAGGAALWTANGAAVSTAAGDQLASVLAADGKGGFIAVWYDDRDGDNDIYAQRIDQYGYLGSPAPSIAAVSDVPGDQGGKVKVAWQASYLDQLSDPELDYYDILRSSPPNVAKAALARGARLVTSPADLAKDDAPCYLVTGSADKAYYWEYLTAIPAIHYLANYSYIAATLGDSTTAGDPATAFMVVGRNSGRTMWWLSDPASGRSVDNLGPATPTFLAARREGDATFLRWLPNTEADLAGYRLYRGSDGGFTPAPANLVAAPADTGYLDAGARLFAWYKLMAVDVHGNESPVATLGPSGVADVPPGGVPAVTRLEAAVPNPFNPATTLAFNLKEAGRARLAVYDAAGRLVRVLVDGDLPAGRHEARWDGRGQRGERVATGVYLCRLEAGAYRATRRITLLQ